MFVSTAHFARCILITLRDIALEPIRNLFSVKEYVSMNFFRIFEQKGMFFPIALFARCISVAIKNSALEPIRNLFSVVKYVSMNFSRIF